MPRPSAIRHETPARLPGQTPWLRSFPGRAPAFSTFVQSRHRLGKGSDRARAICSSQSETVVPPANGLCQPSRAFPITQPPGPPRQARQPGTLGASTRDPTFQGAPGLLAPPAAAASPLTSKPSQVCLPPFSMPFKDKYVSLK